MYFETFCLLVLETCNGNVAASKALWISLCCLNVLWAINKIDLTVSTKVQTFFFDIFFHFQNKIVYLTQFSGLFTEVRGWKQSISIDPIPKPASVLILSIFVSISHFYHGYLIHISPNL